MDNNSSTHSFSPHVQTHNAITILYLLSLSITFLCCYPYSLTQKTPLGNKRQYISFGVGYLFYCCSYITGWIIQLSTTTSITVTIYYLSLGTILFVLFCLKSVIEYNRNGLTFLSHHQDTTFFKLFTSFSSFIISVPEITILILDWSILIIGYFYWISSILIYTSSSCESFGYCYLPIATGTGLLIYGSLTLLHLINVIKLPRQSPSPEFYEAVFMLLWGFISFIWWNTPIVLSSWKAVNLGLLWTTGGMLSLVMTFQPWIVYLQKRNIVNGLIICWTGKSILTGYAADDNYKMELQTTLGYILIIGGLARILQVLFRKSTLDNLPKLYSRASCHFNTNCDDDHDINDDDNTTCVDDLDIGQRRVNEFESTYRQLTGINNHSSSSSCKHQSVYASITLICGLLSCFMAITSGVLFIGTTSNWIDIIRNTIEDPSTYINVVLAISFLWITYIMILSSFYLSSMKSNHHYSYSNIATNDLPISISQPYSPQKYFEVNRMSTPTSSTSSTLYDHSQQQQPSDFTSVPLLPLSSSPPTNSPNSTSPSSPPMRPSQYRAKRRSLLISTAMQNNNNSSTPHSPYDRIRKAVSMSSVSGVGGVLPDDMQDYEYASSPIHINQRYSESSFSSPSRPKSTTSTMMTSLSSSTTTSTSSSNHRHSWQQPSTSLSSSNHANKINNNNNNNNNNSNSNNHHHPSIDSQGSSNESKSLYKTESGKRKERQLKKTKRRRARCTNMDINNNNKNKNNSQGEQDGLTDDDNISTSSGFEERARYNQKNQGYSSERDSSDSHI
ncbi:unnamed protein product [Cunninghamella blakesleeana]